MKRLLIGYDGSECAGEAMDDLRYAGLPGDLDVKLLTVADVWLPPVSEKLEPVYPDLEAKAVRRARANAIEALKQAEEIAQTCPVRFATFFQNGESKRWLSLIHPPGRLFAPRVNGTRTW
jgi:nucleotide-binding universal stress UspA family protein